LRGVRRAKIAPSSSATATIFGSDSLGPRPRWLALTLSGRPYVERQHFLDVASPSFSLARFAQPSRKALARAADQQRRWPTLADDAESLLDLVYGEVLLREQSGETVALEEYLRRFPAHELSLKRQFELHRALPTGALPVSEAVGTKVSSPPSQEQPET